jgi:Holliday junction resolvase-like predicted endonuclease
MLSINLRWQGYSSPDRAKAYENANILAREYEADQIPPDDQLLAEFYDMLPLLARLYDGSPAAQVDQSQAPHELRDGGIPSASSPATGQGSTTDSFLRTMIERCAEDHAFAYFERLGWKVKRVGQFKLGYDLVCMNDDGAVLHVEVKGTRTFGEKVFLTANEVEHVQAAKCEAEHVLYMVSRIQISDDGGARCSDDNVRRFWPWNVGDEDLIPTEYIYTLP